MPLDRVVEEAYLRRTDLQGVDAVRLVSSGSVQFRVIARVVRWATPPEGGFSAPGDAMLTILVEDADDIHTRHRVLKALGIDGNDNWR